jgi:hypothetical protein
MLFPAVIHADMGSFFPVIMFISLPVMGMYLLNKSVMGDIGCITALLMFGTGIYLLGIIWAIKDPWMHGIAVFGLISLTVGMPILNVLTDKLSDKFAEAEQISVCYQLIRINPQNAMAGFRLAKILYHRGEKDTAVAIATGVMPHLPIHAFRDEHRIYANWSTKANPNVDPEISCVACGNMAPRGALICPHCLGSLHLERSRKFSVVHNDKFKKIVTIYATLLIILLAIPLLGQLSPFLSVPTILVMLAISIYAVASAFGMSLSRR